MGGLVISAALGREVGEELAESKGEVGSYDGHHADEAGFESEKVGLDGAGDFLPWGGRYVDAGGHLLQRQRVEGVGVWEIEGDEGREHVVGAFVPAEREEVVEVVTHEIVAGVGVG